MANPTTQEITKTVVDELLETVIGKQCNLVVHNDEINTFDWVIESLIDICNHTPEQAEQCALIIHMKGQYSVRHGVESKLKPMREALVDRGIGATIEYQ
ncbi:MAG: ATP-dependent Clp protease adaptor ClpS [Chitinophagales bacterium]